MLVYGPPFADVGVVGEEARHSRPCVWINLVGKDDTWPLRTLSLEQLREQGRKQGGELLQGLIQYDQLPLGVAERGCWNTHGPFAQATSPKRRTRLGAG